MPTLKESPGADDANSYLTDDEIRAMADERLDADELRADPLPDDVKRAAIMATRRLDQENFDGDAMSETQALAFPRSGITNSKTGADYSSSTIPTGIKRGTFELMLAINAGTFSVDDTGLENIDSMSVGPVNITPRGRPGGSLPANVLREINDFLETGGAVELVRG